MAALSSLLVIPLLASAQSSLPQVDFSKMGSVALGGSFAGLDFYSPSSASSTNVTYSSSQSTLVLRKGDSSDVVPLAQTEDGGRIEAVCYLAGASGSNGTVFVGGSFAELGGVQSRNVAKVDLSSGVVSKLGDGGVQGDVLALYCDPADGGVVWIGGEVTQPIGQESSASASYGGAVLQYKPASDQFSPAPFSGLPSGSVQSISPSSSTDSSSSLLFTGSFDLAYAGSNQTSASSNSSRPTTKFSPSGLPLSNVTVYSPGATPFSSTLSPIPLLGPGVLVDASPTTVLEGYPDPSVLFCPTGPDGINHSWLGRDQGISQVNVQIYRAVTASGVRIGNTFVNGRGTSAFSFVSVPDNTVMTLSYRNPSTGATETCSDSCPLSLDSSIPFQDFLFADGGRELTGFQLTLLKWREEGPGLHLIELLSDGAFASAAPTNSTACSSVGSPATSTLSGTWNTITINTSIGGTTTTALQSIVPVADFSSSSPPTVTFQPYLAGTGNYTVNLLVPGCVNVGDCQTRTSLTVTVQPYQGSPLRTQTVPPSEQDVEYLIYEGAMQASESGGFSPIVTLAMSSTPIGVNGNEYSVAANRVEFKLTTLDTTGTGSNSSQSATGGLPGSGVNGTFGTNSTSAAAKAFGLFEWNRSSTVNASSILANSTQTSFDKAGLALGAALGQSIPSSAVVSAAVLVDSVYYVAGTFDTAHFANIFSFDGTSVGVLPNAGLNGPIHAMVAIGSKLYVGGEFTNIATTGGPLSRLASYDTSAKSWQALGGGVDGAVTGLAVSGTDLLVSGNFSTLLAANSSSSDIESGGFAVWSSASSAWVQQQAVVLGEVATVAVGAGKDAFFAGTITGASSFGADGFVMLSSASDGTPEFNAVPLSFARSSASSSAANSSTNSRRASARRSTRPSSNWLVLDAVAVVKRAFFLPRQSSGASTAPAIPRSSTPAPAVLAAAFWQNTTESGKPSIAVVGGNFTSTLSGTNATNIALYDPSTKTVSALQGSELDGVVRAVAVVGDRAYIGGEFTSNETRTGSDDEGLAVYDLKTRSWDSNTVPGLTASTGSNVSVNVIAPRGTSSTLIVAGSFAQAGALTCSSICAWDTTGSQWSALGNGLSGEVRAIDFAGASSDVMFVAGSFNLPSSTASTFVAKYTFSNSSWSALGDASAVPGPATAIVVDNKNASNIFVAGTSTSSNTSYLLRWDGATWSVPTGATSLEANSAVQQLSFVPLSEAHEGNPVMEDDRMLMVTGALALQGQGAFSSALYDGKTWHPYIKSTSRDGTPGSAAGVFNSQKSFSFSIRRFLARGIVVLICIAIATGLVFLFVLIGVLIGVWRRKNDENRSYPVGKEGDGRDSYSDVNAPAATGSGLGSTRTRSALLDHIDLATAGVITGATGAGGAAAFAAHEKSRTAQQEEYDHNPMSAETAVAGGESQEELYDDEDGEEEIPSRIAHARWSLTPDEGMERELKIRAGQPYYVLNDTSDEWWLCLDPETGEQGAVPASYML